MIKKLQEYLWLCPLLVMAVLFIIANIPNSDTFFLIKTGEYIVENGVPYTNPFVIHENFSIIVQQWLFDVGIYYTYEILGNFGLFLFVMTAFICAVLMMYNFLKLFTNNTMVTKFTTFMFGFLIFGYQTARPSCVSIILFIILLYCLEQYHRTQKTKWLFSLPILSLLQINIHSSMWPLMIVFTIPYFFPHINLKEKFSIKKWFKDNYKILIFISFMGFCGLINPYGIDGILYVIKSYNSANSLDIIELMPPKVLSVNGAVIIVTIILLTIWLPKFFKDVFVNKINKHQDFIRLYGLLGTLLLSVLHIRNMWFLLLWLCPVAIKKMETFTIKKERKTKVFVTILSYTLTILMMCGIIILNNGSYYSLTNSDSKVAPMNAIKYMDKYEKESVILFTEFDNGAYCEFSGYKVYIDARPELFAKIINNKEDIISEYVDLKNGNIDFDKFILKYNFTHMISSNNTLLNAHLRECNDFKLVVEGNGYCLFESIEHKN